MLIQNLLLTDRYEVKFGVRIRGKEGEEEGKGKGVGEGGGEL